MYKYLAFFDLDCTLFDENSQINDEVAETMDQIRKHKGLPIISTGRALFELGDIMRKTKIDTVVATNGDYGQLNGKELFSVAINPKVIDTLFNFSNRYGNSITVINQEENGITTHDDLAIKAYQRVHAKLPNIITPHFWHQNPVNMMVVTNTNLDSEYKEKFKGELTFYRNSPYSIDVVAPGASKATGIDKLIKKGGLNNIPTYAFGDGDNDIPMLDYVDHAVVMGNGQPEVKQHAEFITTDNTNHGIVNGLKHFNLI